MEEQNNCSTPSRVSSTYIDVDNICSDSETGIEQVTPLGSKYWVPFVPDSLKPVKDMIFYSLIGVEKFYEEYAMNSGFLVRKGGAKTLKGGRVKLKRYMCNREGFNPSKNVDILDECNEDEVSDVDIMTLPSNAHLNESSLPIDKQKRERPSHRCGCLAGIRVGVTSDNRYQIYFFEEKHNHKLVHPAFRRHLMSSRRLDFGKKVLLHKICEASIGPVVGHRVLTKIYGGPDVFGATKMECKNYKRDVNAFIGPNDSQMVVDMMSQKKKILPDFSFDYFCGPDGKLGGLFWADEHAKRNYFCFGDVLSFDATYHSNKYDMVFIPFTGIDNHRKCVTFGGAMLSKEDVISYTWMLEAFVKAYPSEPKLLLTDQDPSLKIAIDKVFSTARHRLCMWHIMEKVSSKVGASICNNGFKEKISRIVWTDKLDPSEFDKRWGQVLNEFDLNGNKWLSDMFDLRHYWIPAYFRDWHMSGLMRTSSRSKSENHMFKQLMSSTSTLVEFFSQFDTAMQAQRFEQSRNDHVTTYTTSQPGSGYGFEKNAVMIYTRRVFKGVKKEINHAINSCMSLAVKEENGCKMFVILDNSVSSTDIDETIDRVAKPDYFDELFPIESQVFFKHENEEFSCSCKRYERFGTLCRHIYYVLRIYKFNHFPKNYICKRWTRDVVPPRSYHTALSLGQDLGQMGELMRQIYYNVDAAIRRLMVSKEKMQEYLDRQRLLFDTVDSNMGSAPSMGNKEFIQAFLGISQPEHVTVQNPEGIRNKGSGSHKRIKSSKEQCIEKGKKNKRNCSYCGKYYEHDIRTCTARLIKEGKLPPQ